MEYIIPTELQIKKLNSMFMGMDNSSITLEYCLDRIRLGINAYLMPQELSPMLSDLMLSVSIDEDMHNQLMVAWYNLIFQMYYFIIEGDFILPITEIKLRRHDMVMVTEG